MMTEPKAPLKLDYESSIAPPIGPRPRWVWIVIASYLLILLGVLLSPLWAMLATSDTQIAISATFAPCLVALCGLGLVIMPVRIARRRRITRRSIWIPLLTSGVLLGSLVAAGGLAMSEWFHSEAWIWGGSIGGGA